MANDIGQELLNVPNSPLRPQEPQAAPQKNPAFEQAKQFLSKPENMLTMLVLAGSMMQDRRPGQSKMDAFAERGLGTLGFRGELQRRNKADADTAEANQYERAFKQGQLDVQNRQVDATRENTAADRDVGMAGIGAQVGMSAENRLLQERLAKMEMDTQLRIAGMEKSVAEMGKNTLFSIEDMELAQKVYQTSLDSDNPLTFEQALAKVMRPALLLKAPHLLTFFEPGAVAPKTEVKPAEVKEPKGKPKEKPTYTPRGRPAPAMGLPDTRLGESIGTGSHTAPPRQRTTPGLELLYPDPKRE